MSAMRIGKTKTPSAAPNFAQAAANPWPAARMSDGKTSAGSAYVVALGPALQKKLKRAKPKKTRARCFSAPPGRPSVMARMASAIDITVKPVTCSGIRPSRSTRNIAVMKPSGRKMSSAAVPLVAVMSSAMKLVVEPEMKIPARSVGVKIPTPYMAMSIRNHGTAVKIVRRIMLALNRAGWKRAWIPSEEAISFSVSAGVTFTGTPVSSSVMASASSSWPFWASQRGLSGTRRRSQMMISAGIAPKPSMILHARSTWLSLACPAAWL